MFFFPFSTDTHDGRIQMASVGIILLCLLVHVFVYRDINRIENDIARLQQKAWKNMSDPNTEMLLDAVDPATRKMLQEKMLSQSEEKSGFSTEKVKSFQDRVDSVLQTSLMHKLGLVPARFSYMSLLTYMFTHGGWLHLLGNLLFFYVCAVSMEKFWGFWRFLGIYLICGAGSGLFWMWVSELGGGTGETPLVGASGAIAGMMGAFATSHPKARVRIFWIYMMLRVRYGTFFVKSWIYMGLWFLGEFLNMILFSSVSTVAYSAHVGGFILGAIFGKILKSEDELSVITPSRIGLTKAQGIVSGLENQNFVVNEESGQIATEELMPAIVLGWKALDEGDKPSACKLIIQDMERFFQTREDFRSEIVTNLKKILLLRTELPIPSVQLYQWTRTVAAMKEFELAMQLFDRLVTEGLKENIRLSCLYNSALIRLKTDRDIPRAMNDFRKVLETDPEGVLGKQAKNHLAKGK